MSDSEYKEMYKFNLTASNSLINNFKEMLLANEEQVKAVCLSSLKSPAFKEFVHNKRNYLWYDGENFKVIIKYLARGLAEVYKSNDNFKCYGTKLVSSLVVSSFFLYLEQAQTTQNIWCGWLIEILTSLNLIIRKEEPYVGSNIYCSTRAYYEFNYSNQMYQNFKKFHEQSNTNVNITEEQKRVKNSQSVPHKEAPKVNHHILGNGYVRETYKILNKKGILFDHCEETIDLISDTPLVIRAGVSGLEFNPDLITKENMPKDTKLSFNEYKDLRIKNWQSYGQVLSESIKEYSVSQQVFFNGYIPDSRGRLYIDNSVGNYISNKQVRAVVEFANKEEVKIDDKYKEILNIK